MQEGIFVVFQRKVVFVFSLFVLHTTHLVAHLLSIHIASHTNKSTFPQSNNNKSVQ